MQKRSGEMNALLAGGEMGKVPVSTASVQSSLNFPMKYKVKDCGGYVDHKWGNQFAVSAFMLLACGDHLFSYTKAGI